MIEPSNNKTKEWRCNQPWYLNWKHKECEKYQISLIEEITGVKVNKTNKRINLITSKKRILRYCVAGGSKSLG